MSTNVQKSSVYNASQVSHKPPVGNSVQNSNTQNLMGQTVLNTVYQVQSQVGPQNTNASVQKNLFEKEKTINSRVNNNKNIQNTVNSLPTNTQNKISSPAVPKNGTAFQKSSVAGPKSRIGQTIVRDGKTITNIDLNDDIEESQNLSLSQNDDNPTKESAHVPNSQNNKASLMKSQNQNLPTLSQQIKYSAVQSVNPQMQSVQKGSVNPQMQSVPKGSVNPQMSSVPK